MGQAFAFSCPDCGYSAEIAGGMDFGQRAMTISVVCLECRELTDQLAAELNWGIH